MFFLKKIMPAESPLILYRYTAITSSSLQVIEGEYKSSSPDALYTFLKEKNLSLISYKKQNTPFFILFYRRSKVLRLDELRDFFFHLSNFLLLGVPVFESIKNIQETPCSPTLTFFLKHLEETLSNGVSLSQSFDKAPVKLPLFILPLLRIAEKTGNLSAISKELFLYFKEAEAIYKMFKKSFRYPLILMGVITLTLLSLFFFLVPELSRFLTLTKQNIPFSTLLLIHTKDFIVLSWKFILFALALFFLFLKTRPLAPSLAYYFFTIFYKIPFLGKLKKLQEQAYFVKAFSLLLTHQVPFYEALLTLEKASSSLFLKQDLQHVLKKICEGKNPSLAFQGSFYGTSFFQKLLAIGESSNSLGETLTLGSQYAQSLLQETQEAFLKKLEPFLTLLLGGILLWIASAFILPLYDSLLYLDSFS